jgi:hypothetical protein
MTIGSVGLNFRFQGLTAMPNAKKQAPKYK